MSGYDQFAALHQVRVRDAPSRPLSSPYLGSYLSDQFAALHQHFIHVGVKTQAILLTAYAKLVNLYPDTQVRPR